MGRFFSKRGVVLEGCSALLVALGGGEIGPLPLLMRYVYAMLLCR